MNEKEKDREIERLRQAIERHKAQLDMRERGYRISSTAADQELWKVLETPKPK